MRCGGAVTVALMLMLLGLVLGMVTITGVAFRQRCEQL
jgi:TRAP-type uncharacterized transport system fused permease subunit